MPSPVHRIHGSLGSPERGRPAGRRRHELVGPATPDRPRPHRSAGDPSPTPAGGFRARAVRSVHHPSRSAC
jgi:hypothetical protein